MTPTDRRPAVAYLRVSTDTQVTDGFGLDIQRAAVTELAAAERLDLVAVYSDEGISGKEDLGARAGLALVLDAVENGIAQVVLIPRLDRLARDLMIQERMLAEFWRHDAEVISCSPTERTYCHPDDPDDPTRKLMRQLLGALAEYERGMIALRTSRGRRRLLDRQGYAGGPQPYGWANPTEQQVLASVTAARQQGYSFRVIAEKLNARGSMKRSGRPWTPQEIHRVFKRAALRPQVTARPAIQEQHGQAMQLI